MQHWSVTIWHFEPLTNYRHGLHSMNGATSVRICTMATLFIFFWQNTGMFRGGRTDGQPRTCTHNNILPRAKQLTQSRSSSIFQGAWILKQQAGCFCYLLLTQEKQWTMNQKDGDRGWATSWARGPKQKKNMSAGHIICIVPIIFTYVPLFIISSRH
jgi:hypothetical protein